MGYGRLQAFFTGAAHLLHIDDCSVPCVPASVPIITVWQIVCCLKLKLMEMEFSHHLLYDLHLWLSYCDMSSVTKGLRRIVHKMSALAAKCQMASVWLFFLHFVVWGRKFHSEEKTMLSSYSYWRTLPSFQLQAVFSGHYLRTACLFSYRKDTYFWVCIIY